MALYGAALALMGSYGRALIGSWRWVSRAHQGGAFTPDPDIRRGLGTSGTSIPPNPPALEKANLASLMQLAVVVGSHADYFVCSRIPRLTFPVEYLITSRNNLPSPQLLFTAAASSLAIS